MTLTSQSAAQNDTQNTKAQFYLSLFSAARQKISSELHRWLIGGVPYISFKVFSKEHPLFFFFPFFCNRPAVLSLHFNNTTTFARRLDIAPQQVHLFILSCFFCYQALLKTSLTLEKTSLNFVAFAAQRKRYRAKGVVFSSLLGDFRPVENVGEPYFYLVSGKPDCGGSEGVKG